MTTAHLPPGTSGLPVVGETLAFLKDGFGFTSSRIKAHGPVFRTRILGKNAIVMAGPEASTWWTNGDVLERRGATPGFVLRLLGGEILLFIDAVQHRARKQQILAGFSRAALEGYLPDMQGAIEASLADLASQGEVALVPALRRMAIEVICGSVFGLSRGPELDSLLADYSCVLRGFTSLPVPLPWTAMGKAYQASERILARIRSLAAGSPPEGSALARVLAATSSDGQPIAVEDACRELYHVVIAGLIVFAELARIVMALDELPDVRRRTLEDVTANAPSGPIDLATIRKLSYVHQLVMETKRVTPIVPAGFARARESFQIAGHTVPKGWLVLWSPWHSMQLEGLYTEPERFDPDRFSQGRAEQKRHEHAFVPQGAGKPDGHLCAGVDYSSVFMALFTTLLARDYTVELPAQDRSYVWARLPPEPRDGLRARLKRRAE